MFNYADIAVLGFAAIFCVLGYFRGFIRSLTKLFGTFTALIIAGFLCDMTASALSAATPLGGWLADAYDGMLAPNPALGAVVGEGTDSLAVLNATLTECGVPGFLAGWFASIFAGFIPAAGVYTVSRVLAAYLAHATLCAGCFVLLFAGIRAVFAMITKLLSLLRRDAFLHIVDRLCGLVFGAAKSLLYLLILFVLATPILNQPFAEPAREQLAEGKISSVLYEKNPLKTLAEKYLDFSKLFDKITGAASAEDAPESAATAAQDAASQSSGAAALTTGE